VCVHVRVRAHVCDGALKDIEKINVFQRFSSCHGILVLCNLLDIALSVPTWNYIRYHSSQINVHTN